MRKYRQWYFLAFFVGLASFSSAVDIWIKHDKAAIPRDIAIWLGVVLTVWLITYFGPRWRYYKVAIGLAFVAYWGFNAISGWERGNHISWFLGAIWSAFCVVCCGGQAFYLVRDWRNARLSAPLEIGEGKQ